MSFLSGLFGGDKTPLTGPRDHTTSSDIFNSAPFSTSSSYSGSSLSSSPSSESSSSSSGASSSSQSGFASSPQAPFPSLPTASDTLTSALDPAALHPLAGLGKNLDFLQLDEDKLTDVQGAASVLPSRGWTDDLCVGTGTTYASGELDL